MRYVYIMCTCCSVSCNNSKRRDYIELLKKAATTTALVMRSPTPRLQRACCRTSLHIYLAPTNDTHEPHHHHNDDATAHSKTIERRTSERERERIQRQSRQLSGGTMQYGQIEEKTVRRREHRPISLLSVGAAVAPCVYLKKKKMICHQWKLGAVAVLQPQRV